MRTWQRTGRRTKDRTTVRSLSPALAPTSLSATTFDDDRIDLSWTAPASDGGFPLIGYKIERKVGAGAWATLVANTGTLTTTYSDTGLEPATLYTYRVSAISTEDTGPASNEASDTTDSAPGADNFVMGGSAGAFLYPYTVTAGVLDTAWAASVTPMETALGRAAVSPDGKYLAAISSGRIRVWPISGATLGCRYPDIHNGLGTTPIAGNAVGCAWSPDGAYLAVSMSSSPYLKVFPWSPTTGLGAAVSNPASLPAGTVNDVAWSPDGAFIALAVNVSPYITAYPWSAGFGAKLSNPGTLPAGAAQRVAWAPGSDYVGVAHTTTPFVAVYPVSGGAFGTKVANPASLPPNNGTCIRWLSATRLFVGNATTSPYMSLYPWSAGFGAKRADPATLPPGVVRDVSLNDAADTVGITSDVTPYAHLYAWDGSDFGAKAANPAVLPPGATVNGIFAQDATPDQSEVILLPSGAQNILSSGSGTRTAGFRSDADGAAQSKLQTAYADLGGWAVFGDPADYEVRFTQGTPDGGGTFNGTLNTWLPGDQNNEVSWVSTSGQISGNGGTTSCEVTVEVRRLVGGAVLSTETYSLVNTDGL